VQTPAGCAAAAAYTSVQLWQRLSVACGWTGLGVDASSSGVSSIATPGEANLEQQQQQQQQQQQLSVPASRSLSPSLEAAVRDDDNSNIDSIVNSEEDGKLQANRSQQQQQQQQEEEEQPPPLNAPLLTPESLAQSLDSVLTLQPQQPVSLSAPVVRLDERTLETERKLACFWRAAYKKDKMSVEVIEESDCVLPYTMDKFEGRCDLLCRALLQLRLEKPHWLPAASTTTSSSSTAAHEAAAAARTETASQIANSVEEKSGAPLVSSENLSPPPVTSSSTSTAATTPVLPTTAVAPKTWRIASLGGGPGCDAAGALLFNALAVRAEEVQVTVLDFCAAWKPVVEAVGQWLQLPHNLPEVMQLPAKITAATAATATSSSSAAAVALSTLPRQTDTYANDASLCEAKTQAADESTVEIADAGLSLDELDMEELVPQIIGALPPAESVDDENLAIENLGESLPGTSVTSHTDHEGVSSRVRVAFELVDVKLSVDSEVNRVFVHDILPDCDLFLYCFVCHETQAQQFELFAHTLRNCRIGSVLLFLDIWLVDMQNIEQAVQKVIAPTCPNRQFECHYLGSKQAFPFKGLAVRPVLSSS
jgi:hypothetical protein